MGVYLQYAAHRGENTYMGYFRFGQTLPVGQRQNQLHHIFQASSKSPTEMASIHNSAKAHLCTVRSTVTFNDCGGRGGANTPL